MNILCGPYKTPLRLSATTWYQPEQIEDMLRVRRGPYFLEVEGVRIRLEPSGLPLACQVVAAYHGAISYNAPIRDDFGQTITQIEAEVEARMGESESEEDVVTSEDDLVYEEFFYQ